MQVQIGGARLIPGHLDTEAQTELLQDVRNIVRTVPLTRPETRWGKQMSVGMTSAGKVGWISDRRGYRYASQHPSGATWPPIPASVLSVWESVTGVDREPDCCLVNFYREGARMGLHQDKDEASFEWPVVSISLGDDALFRIGGTKRGDSTRSVWLKSGDVLVLEGDARLAYHGVDRIRAGTSSLLAEGGRFNLTLRVVE